MSEIHLSVVIPAYNEEKRIGKTLQAINRYLREQKYLSEIIVVSDGSKDKTAQVVEELKSKILNLRLIDNKENHGKGYVVRQGLMEAQGEYRLFTDADNSTSIDQVEKMWPQFKKDFDIVIGSRDIKGAVLDPHQPWIRSIVLGEGFKLFRKIVIGLWEIEDTQCGFKGFKGEIIDNIFSKCKIDLFAFDPEILVIAKKLGYKIKEVPVTWKNDPDSKVKLKSMIKMAQDLIKIRINSLKKLYG